MIVITLNDKKFVDRSLDGLGREWVGYDTSMTPEEIYERNRGCWHLGSRADKESFALFTHKGVGVLAMEIHGIAEDTKRPGRRILEGKVLGAGDPVHDNFVGRAVDTSRNPVRYIDSEYDATACLCGCGEQVVRRDFASGHDQRAIHERIAKVGTVREFLAWFDRTWQEG